MSTSADRRRDRKVGQICREVSRTLACALGASHDGVIGDLTVVAVEPAPDRSRLMVTVCSASASQAELPIVRERLLSGRGFLRAEIAAALQRKRTPELAFRIVPAR